MSEAFEKFMIDSGIKVWKSCAGKLPDFRFVYEAGQRSGMERAAEIAGEQPNTHSPKDVSIAIRKEITP
jgi:hypothetical protein